jgi:hypothetical protein
MRVFSEKPEVTVTFAYFDEFRKGLGEMKISSGDCVTKIKT